MPAEIRGIAKVELLKSLFQDFAFGAAVVQRLGVYRAVMICRRSVFQLIERGKAKLGGSRIIELIDQDAVFRVFLKPLFNVAGRNVGFDRVPILAGNPEQAVMLNDFLGVQRHCFGAVGIQQINGYVTLHQFQGAVF